MPSSESSLTRSVAWKVGGATAKSSSSPPTAATSLLLFAAASPVGAWEATMFLQRDAVASPLPGTEITAVFGEDDMLSGSAGCNTYSAAYTTEGTLAIEAPVATRMACAKPAGVMEQEQAYLSALPLAVGYRVEGSMLSLVAADGTYVATYARTP